MKSILLFLMARKPHIALIPCDNRDDEVIFLTIGEFAAGLRDQKYKKDTDNAEVFWEFRENGFYMRGHIIENDRRYLFSFSLPKSQWQQTEFSIFAVEDKTGQQHTLLPADIREMLSSKTLIFDNMREKFFQYRSDEDCLLSWGGAHIKNISATLYIRIKSFLE